MTRPIYEPSQTRADAFLDYQQKQLFRRPAPHSTSGGLAYAYAEWLTGGDVPNNSEVNPADLDGGTPYDQCYINPEGLALTEQPMSVDLVNGSIEWCSPGLYLAQFVVIWADTWVAPQFVMTKLNLLGNSVSTANCCSWASRDYIHNDWQVANYEATGMFVVPLPADCNANFNGIYGTVAQKSGSDKFLSSAALIVTKLAEFDPDTGQFCV